MNLESDSLPMDPGRFKQNSRLKGSNAGRVDSFGTPIQKGNGHKISFAPELEKVIPVENWKEYYVQDEEGGSTCRCEVY